MVQAVYYRRAMNSWMKQCSTLTLFIRLNALYIYTCIFKNLV